MEGEDERGQGTGVEMHDMRRAWNANAGNTGARLRRVNSRTGGEDRKATEDGKAVESPPTGSGLGGNDSLVDSGDNLILPRMRTELKLLENFEEAPHTERLLPLMDMKSFNIKEMALQTVPIIEVVRNYSTDFLKSDMVAGITIGVFVIPQGMAYALLAGIPVQYGLYTSFFPSLLYTLFGTSRHMHIGPFALVSLMVGDTIEELGVDGEEDPQAAETLAVAMSFVVGVMLLAMAVCRLGIIITFLSDTVLEGFTVGASILICTSQLKHILGLSIPRGTFIETLVNLGKNIGKVNPATILISLVSMTALVTAKMYSQRRNMKIPIPIELIVVVISTLISTLADFEGRFGVAVVGEVPPGLPPPSAPDLSTFSQLFVPCITITVVLFVICASIVKTFAMKHGYDTNENQELIALGLANILGGMWQCYPACGSLSRSAVVSNIGGKTQVYNAFVCVVLLVCLMALTPLLTDLPNAVLGSVILVAFRTLIRKLGSLKILWHQKKSDFLSWLSTFLATIFLGTTFGLLIGFGVSILILLQQSARAEIAELGNLPGTEIFRNIKCFPRAKRLEGTAIVRFGGNVNFVNRKSFKEQLLSFAIQKPPLKNIALDMSMVNSVDMSGLNMLKSMTKIFRGNKIQILLVGCRGPVRAFFQRSKFSDEVEMDRWFINIQSAIDYLRTQDTDEGNRVNGPETKQDLKHHVTEISERKLQLPLNAKVNRRMLRESPAEP